MVVEFQQVLLFSLSCFEWGFLTQKGKKMYQIDEYYFGNMVDNFVEEQVT